MLRMLGPFQFARSQFTFFLLDTQSEGARKELRLRAEQYLERAEYLKQLLKEQESEILAFTQSCSIVYRVTSFRVSGEKFRG